MNIGCFLNNSNGFKNLGKLLTTNVCFNSLKKNNVFAIQNRELLKANFFYFKIPGDFNMGWNKVFGKFKNSEECFKKYSKKEIEAEILDYEIKEGTDGIDIVYAAQKENNGNVSAVICLIDTQSVETDGKPMQFVRHTHESKGSHETKCPQRILDLLSAPVNEYSATWRKECGDKRKWNNYDLASAI